MLNFLICRTNGPFFFCKGLILGPYHKTETIQVLYKQNLMSWRGFGPSNFPTTKPKTRGLLKMLLSILHDSSMNDEIYCTDPLLKWYDPR